LLAPAEFRRLVADHEKLLRDVRARREPRSQRAG
jgi:hypothetical protein